MRRCYLIGPMRGYPQYNFPAFDAASAKGRALGLSVVSPADEDRKHGFCPSTPESKVSVPAACRMFAERDVAIILSLHAEDGDFVAVLPGWCRSVGSIAEVALAGWTMLPVYNALTWRPMTRGEIALTAFKDICMVFARHLVRSA